MNRVLLKASLKAARASSGRGAVSARSAIDA